MSKPSIRHEDRLLAALAYPFWYLVFALVYLSPERKQSRFLRYHAYQGLVLGLVLWIGGILAWTTAAIVGNFFIIFSLLLYPVLRLLQWGAFVITVYASISAWFGRMVELPFVTEFTRPIVEESSESAS